MCPLAVVSVFCGLVLALPPQMHELYRAMAEAMAIGKSGAWSEPAIAGLLLLVLTGTLFFAMTCLGQRLLPRSQFQRLRWPAAAISVAPLLGASAGVINSRIPDGALKAVAHAVAQARAQYLRVDDATITVAQAMSIGERFAKNILASNDYLLAFAVALIVAALVAVPVLGLVARTQCFGRFQRVSLKSASLALGASTVLLVTVLAIPASQIAVTQAVTPVGVLCVFFVLFASWIAYLRVLTRMTGWPVVATLVCAALLFSGLDLNDNHKVRTDSATESPAATRSDGRAAFKSWLKSRSNFGDYTGKKFPVYVVAAQGGGIYAAYHAASFLASIQDECDNFATHIFAISGVSGGSVGAGVFASLVHQYGLADPERTVTACPAGGAKANLFVNATTEILSQDLFSPLEAGLLFPDFAQRFLFWRVASFDRARALEYALEQAWDEVVAQERFKVFQGPSGSPKNPLAEPYLSLWKPGAKRTAPALILNTTEVHSGRRRLVSPFTIKGIDLKFLPVWRDSPVSAVERTAVLTRMPLSAGAFLSARFPWVTPAGWFEDIAEATETQTASLSKIRVVDGGYFENSGIVTAMDVVATIEEAMNSDSELMPLRDRIEINVITLNSKDFSVRDFYGLAEILEPIRTMLSTRSARSPIETIRAQQLLTVLGGSVAKNFFRFDLSGAGYPLPLGWRLSPVTRQLISHQLGFRQECPASAPKLNQNPPLTLDCLRKVLFLQLTKG